MKHSRLRLFPALLVGALIFVFPSARMQALTYHWTKVPISSPLGSVGAIAVAPSRPSTVYASSGAGFFVSSDSGATWSLRSEMLPAPDLTFDFSLPVPALAVDPTNPDVVWAGFGPLSKSTDGGATWTPVHVDGDFPVYAIALDPNAPGSHLYVAASVGLYETHDGGATWILATNGIAPSTNFLTLAIAPSDHRVLYGGSGYSLPAAGVYKSPDGGATWIRTSSPVPNPDVRALAVDPTDANVVYRSDASVGISKSTDGGAHWNVVVSVRGVASLVIDPTNPRTVYAGSDEGTILKTTDAGATWALADAGILHGLAVLALVIDPASPAHLLAGTRPIPGQTASYSGIFESTDAGATWQPSAQLFGAATLSIVAVDPRMPSSLFLDDRRSTDGGATWQPLGFVAGLFVFDPRDASTIYASGLTLHKTTDGGVTWAELAVPPPAIGLAGLVVDPASSSTLYAVAGNGVSLTSLDGGATWTQRIFVQPSVNSFAEDPVSPHTLYAGNGIGLFESTDAGVTWFHVHGPWPDTDITGVVGVRVVGTRPSTGAVYVATDGEDPASYVTTNGGATWTRLPVGFADLTPDPSTGYLYGLTADGLSRSTDGASWVSVNDGLPSSVFTSSIAIDPLSSTLYVISLGELFRATFVESPSCSADESSLCLNASRFRVRAVWRTSEGVGGLAQSRPDTADTGAFWFFSANNIELVVKVVDGRPANGHFWVFGAALTNVEYAVEVVDTEAGTLWTHHNPQGALASFADTTAFGP